MVVVTTNKNSQALCQLVLFDDKSSMVMSFSNKHAQKKEIEFYFDFFRFNWFWFSSMILGILRLIGDLEKLSWCLAGVFGENWLKNRFSMQKNLPHDFFNQHGGDWILSLIAIGDMFFFLC